MQPPVCSVAGLRLTPDAMTAPTPTPGRTPLTARELKYEDGKAKVVNGLGEFFFAIEADPKSGVIDMYAGPSEDELGLFPTRVVELPGGRSAYSFTMFKAPEMPDELFESQYESLRREFDNIRRRFSAEHATCAR